MHAVFSTFKARIQLHFVYFLAHLWSSSYRAFSCPCRFEYLWLTCELTKRKCICKKVNKAWRIGWAIRMFSTQFFSIVACIAISNPVKIRVPRPKTAKNIWISTILYINPFLVRLAKVQIHSSTSSFYTYFRFISLVQFWSILVCVRWKRSHFWHLLSYHVYFWSTSV